jgi:hypothetical protein
VDPSGKLAEAGPVHLGPASNVLEEDRPELDKPQGGLAPGDDGVHAGAVRVVRADAAIAIAVQGRGVTAIPAVSLTGDQIDEGGIRDLLHCSLMHCSRNVWSIGFPPGRELGTAGRGNGVSIRGRLEAAKREFFGP